MCLIVTGGLAEESGGEEQTSGGLQGKQADSDRPN